MLLYEVQDFTSGLALCVEKALQKDSVGSQLIKYLPVTQKTNIKIGYFKICT